VSESEYVPNDYRWLRSPAVPYTRGRWQWEAEGATTWLAHDQELRPLFRVQQLAGTASDLARFRAAAALHIALTRLTLIVRDFLDTHATAVHCDDPVCAETLQRAVVEAERLLWELPPGLPGEEPAAADLSRAS